VQIGANRPYTMATGRHHIGHLAQQLGTIVGTFSGPTVGRSPPEGWGDLWVVGPFVVGQGDQSPGLAVRPHCIAGKGAGIRPIAAQQERDREKSRRFVGTNDDCVAASVAKCSVGSSCPQLAQAPSALCFTRSPTLLEQRQIALASPALVRPRLRRVAGRTTHLVFSGTLHGWFRHVASCR